MWTGLRAPHTNTHTRPQFHRGESILCLFQLLVAVGIPRLVAASLCFIFTQPSPLWASTRSSVSNLPLSLFLRTLAIGFRAQQDNPQ